MHKRDSQVLLAEGQAVFPKEALNLADLCFKSDTFMEQPHNPYHKPKKNIYIYIFYIEPILHEIVRLGDSAG